METHHKSGKKLRRIPAVIESLESRQLLSLSIGNLSGAVTEPAPAGGSQTYTFSLALPGSIYIGASGTVTLRNSANTVLATTTGGTLPFRSEPAGSYSVSVSGDTTSVFIVGELTGQTRATAQNLGTLDASSKTTQSWIGSLYPDNYYSFKLTDTGATTIHMTPTTSTYLQVALTDANGNVLNNGGTTNTITRTLSAGTYYAHVYRRLSGDHSNYSLSIQSTRVTPTITTITRPTGYFGYGKTVSFTVAFNANVIVTGVPQLAFSGGSATRYAKYVSGSGTNKLTFNYVVQHGDNTTGPTISSLNLNGGTIKGINGSTAVLTGWTVSSSAATLWGDAPTVTTITPPANGTYTPGQTLAFSFAFSHPVKITGTPELQLNIGGVTKYATGAINPSGGITFSYTVASGDVAPNGISIVSPMLLNGSTITDLAGNAATLTFTPPTTTGIKIGQAPTIVNVLFGPFGSLSPGMNYSVRILYSEAVTVTGTPSVTLQYGSTTRQATFYTQPQPNEVDFLYTVQNSDIGGPVTVVGPVLLNGGTIVSAQTQIAAIETFTPAVLPYQTYFNGGNATLTSWDLPAVGNYYRNQLLSFTLHFDYPVNVSGSVQVEIPLGRYPFPDTVIAANYVSGSGTNALVFSRYVQTTDEGFAINTAYINLNGGSITSAVNSTAAKLNPPPPFPSQSPMILVEGAHPLVTAIDGVAPGTYNAGQTLTFVAHFSEPVTVKGAPVLTVYAAPSPIPAPPYYANYVSGNGTNALTFSFTIPAGAKIGTNFLVNFDSILNPGLIVNSLNQTAYQVFPVQFLNTTILG